MVFPPSCTGDDQGRDEAERAACRAALAVAEARVDGSARRLVDAVRTAGAARDDVGRMAAEAAWLRSLIAEAKTGEQKAREEAAWAQRGLLELTQLSRAQAQETAWLRGCLADAEARVAAEVRARAEAEARVHGHAAALAALHASTSWRVTAPLRRLRGHQPAPPPTPPTGQDAPFPAEAGEGRGEDLPARSPAPPALRTLTPPPSRSREREPESVAVPKAARPPAPAIRDTLVATVHQFHAGSAAGDAITNAMLLIRRALRRAGFRSDIFVETLGPGLDGSGIRTLDAMPRHGGYVLLLHHSMGFPGFDAVLALPARKVLVYHNITPPELLAGIPRIQRLAVQGREQLARLRHAVAVALADSDANALELHRLRFPAVRTCPLLFDVAATRRDAAAPRPGDGVFTVLFVGRITPSKAQDELVDGFAAFHARFGRPCRLVLVGALHPDEHGFIARITSRAEAAGLADAVLLTGSVSDAELRGWYRQADLYVSLSRHEGFGVPLAEAMAHGIPAVAWPTGAVPFTLAGAGLLLTGREPGTVAAAMLAAHADRSALAARGQAAVARWALDRHLPTLMSALAAAGAVPPRRDTAALAANLQVTLAGHVGKSYSLAAVNRGIARTIDRARPGSIRLRPVEGRPTDDLSEVPEAERACVAALAARPAPDTGPELVLSAHYPLHRPEAGGDLLAALVFWEESLVPPATVAALNEGFGAVFSPSAAVTRALVDSGVSVPVLTLGLAPELHPFLALDPARERPGPFTFLHVSSAFPRKGLDVLLAAWARAFTAADPVRLVIKTFPNPHHDAPEQLRRFRTGHPGAAPVTLVNEDLPADAVLALYRDANAAVLPTRGEGYNLPAAEAMAAGLPVITTGHGGHLDWCSHGTARLLPCQLAPSRSHLAAPHALWAEPDGTDLVAALKEAASGALAGRAEAGRRAVAAQADGTAWTARLARAAARLIVAPPAPPLRLAWVSSWDVRCGIAEYSRALLGALPADGLAQPVILADDRTPPGSNTEPAWRAGDAGSVDGLLPAIGRADADVVVVQHQPGLLPWPGLAALLRGIAAPHRIAAVALHNTAHLLDIPEADRADAVAALRGAGRVLVHTLADLRRLHALGLAGNATLLPHAAAAPARAPIRPLPNNAAPVLGCTGFFLPGKGIPELIAAAARLRGRWPALRLRLVNAEYGDPASAAEIARCRALAAAEGVAVEWHTGFVPLPDQQRLLEGCDLIVLPYQHSKEGSSAALRSALATGIPVAVTPLPVFEDAEGAVFRLPGLDTAPVALGIGSLLGSTERRAALARAAEEWAAARALPDIARRLHGMLLGLAAQSRHGQPTNGAPWPG